MKKIKIICFLFSMLVFFSCKKDIDTLNQDIKNPSSVPPGSLFTAAVKNLADNMTTPNVNVGIFRLLAQQWTETTYTDESNYDLNTRNIPQNFWNVMYRDVLNNLSEAARLVPAQDSLETSAATMRNQTAQIEIITVYTYMVLVDTYGNIPYSEALNIADVTPAYDDAQTIYLDLLRRLDAAIAMIDVNAGGFAENDLLLGDDMSQWVKFANSLKLRMGMQLADVDPAIAQTNLEAAAPYVLQSNNDNIMFRYLSAPPNTNPVWVNLVQSGRKDFVAANTLVDFMIANDDPRIPFYFTVDANNDYSGGENGSGNNYATYSKPNERLTDPSYPADLLDFSEVQFLLAEAVERGFNVGGTAEAHYDSAIIASIEFWGGTEAEALDYLSQPDVNYTTAPGNFKEKIGRQLWVALYNNGFEAWTQWRRLDAPTLVAPPDALSDIPLRYTYPVQEQNLNTTNYNNAVNAIGADNVSTRIFWDIY